MLVCGTATEVGKTWVAARLVSELAGRGLRVAARKPAQSFDVDADDLPMGGPSDAEVLGAASGEPASEVCTPSRSYHRPMAPPMAAEALGRPLFTTAELVADVVWPTSAVDVGVVETAGGVRSPQSSDGDVTDLVRALRPERIVLVADAGLGTINAVRLSMDALAGASSVGEVPIVVLDRFDGEHDLHRRNRSWLAERDRYVVVTLPGEERALADLVTAP